MATRETGIRLETLDGQQLTQLKERLTNELQSFARSGNQLALAASKFEESRQSVSALAQTKEGHSLLLPLTQSLYVSGTIGETDKVMIDIGTGYYVEKVELQRQIWSEVKYAIGQAIHLGDYMDMTVEEGQEYCKRKVVKLQESLGGIQQLMRERQGMINQVSRVLADKIAASQQAQQAAS